LAFIIPNLRLAELVAIVTENRRFFEDFLAYLQEVGYADPHAFVSEPSDDRAIEVIAGFLSRSSTVALLNGLGKPYDNALARWYFLAWLFRDAPAQRLRPLVDQAPGATIEARRAWLLNEIRKFVAPLFPEGQSWSWAALSEVMLARLEGSRRALKGTLFETIVRGSLRTIFQRHGIDLKVHDGEVRLHDETYDVQVSGPRGSVLIPVKTRETMGGGHAMLFTRDIHKSISIAESSGYHCLPIIIAESWGGDLESLKCEHYIYIQANPNQVTQIEPLLLERLEELISVFKSLAEG